jgi:hypothetical protein
MICGLQVIIACPLGGKVPVDPIVKSVKWFLQLHIRSGSGVIRTGEQFNCIQDILNRLDKWNFKTSPMSFLQPDNHSCGPVGIMYALYLANNQVTIGVAACPFRPFCCMPQSFD